MNYGTLKTAVAQWLHRKDLAARIPEFIELLESRFNAEITSNRRDAVAYIDASANTATTPLPADLYQLRSVRIIGNVERVLSYGTNERMTALVRSGSGIPSSFDRIGADIRFAPIPDANYRVEIVYQQRIPALSDANPSNWILKDYPDAYLYGTLLIAQPFVQDDERMQAYAPMYQQALHNINAVDWQAGSTLRVRAI